MNAVPGPPLISACRLADCPAVRCTPFSDQHTISHSAAMIIPSHLATQCLVLRLCAPGAYYSRHLAVGCRHAPTHPGDVSTCWRRVAWVSEAATGFRLSSLSSVPPYPVLTIGRETLGSTQNDLVCKVGDWSIALAYVDASQLYRHGIAWQ